MVICGDDFLREDEADNCLLHEWKSVLSRHVDSVSSVAFSANGQYVVSGSDDRSLILWDAAVYKSIASLKGHKNNVSSVAFCPDSRCIVSGSWDKSLILWDVASKKSIGTLEGHSAEVTSVAFSSDGKSIVSGSCDNTLMLWDAHALTLLASLRGHTESVTSVVFHPHGTHIVSGSDDNSLILWDAALRKSIARLSGHESRVTSVAFSPDGSHVVSGSDDWSLIVWDVALQTSIAILHGHTGWIRSVAFSPDGKHIVSASEDRSVIKWNVKRLQSERMSHDKSHPHSPMAANVSTFSLYQSTPAPIHEASKDAVQAKLFFPNAIYAAAYCEETGKLAVAHGKSVSILEIDTVLNATKTQPQGFLPTWYLRELIENDADDLLIRSISNNPGSLCNENQRYYHDDPNNSVILKLIDLDKLDVLAELLSRRDASTVCMLYRLDSVVKNIMASAHSWKDEALSIVLKYISFRICEKLPIPSHDDDATLPFLAQALRSSSLRPVVIDFFANTTLEVARPRVSIEFKNGSSKFGEVLTTVPSSLKAPLRLWQDAADQGVLPSVGEIHFSEFLVTPFPGIAQSGLIEALIDQNLTELFDTIMVRSVMDYKWKLARPGYTRDTCIYIFFVVVLSVFSILHQQLSADERSVNSLLDANEPLAFASMITGLIAFVVDPLYTLVQESLQLRGFGARIYFSDLCNIFDVLRIHLAIAAGVLILLESHRAFHVVLAILLYLRWFGLLFYIQAYSSTGHLVRMILQITYDIRYLLMILALSILAASFAFSALQTDSSDARHVSSFMFDFFNILILNNGYEPTDLAYSGFAAVKIILFLVSMIFVPIILLDLLIAIMSDSFEHIQDKAFVELNHLRAKVIREQEFNLFNRLKIKGKTNVGEADDRYIHVMVPKGANVPRGKGLGYQGVLHEMKGHIDERVHDLKADGRVQRSEMTAQVAKVRLDVSEQIDVVRAEFTAEVDSVKADLRAQIADLKMWMMANVVASPQDHFVD